MLAFALLSELLRIFVVAFQGIQCTFLFDCNMFCSTRSQSVGRLLTGLAKEADTGLRMQCLLCPLGSVQFYIGACSYLEGISILKSVL
jgi:hypothetical protein